MMRALVVLSLIALSGLGLPAVPPAAAQEAPAGAAPGEALPVARHTLDNGMTFLILPRRQSPTVSLVVHYPVGSINERLGNTGIAHVLEHMLFKGSEEIGTRDRAGEAPLMDAADAARDSMIAELFGHDPDSAEVRRLQSLTGAIESQAHALSIPNEFDRILTAHGARGLNATTAHESTRYFVELPANRLELWFLLEADRMKNPVMRGFTTELDVVREERRMRLETSPGGILETSLLATAFQVHPYGVPVIGHAADLEFLTRRQVLEYFRAYYGARNAVAAIVGNVDPGQVVEWAEKYFGGVPPGIPAAPVTAREPEQAGERRIEVEFDAEPRIMLGWRGVSGLHEDAAALSMLASVLTAGRTTRLYQRLIARDQSALHVSAYQGPGFAHPRLFVVSAVPRSPHTPADLEAAIYEEIEAIKREPPDAAALLRIRNQISAGEFRRLSSNLELAMQIAASQASFGDWRETFRLSRRISDVTPEDVQRVAARYLKPSTRTVATMVRKGSS